jgi:hypothetical protein
MDFLLTPHLQNTHTVQDLTTADCFQFLALQAVGKNPSSLLEAIRTDNLETFFPYVAQHDFKQTIPYS